MFHLVEMGYFIIYAFIISVLKVEAEMTNMKIVDEPSSYGLQNSVGNYYQQSSDNLKMRVPPANFSGPQHLERMKGRCYSKVIDSYKYELCPFSNITQYEQSLRWNPYSGVLGVWQDWEIKNNTFIAMIMANGDNCGDKFRLVKVFLECGAKSEILNMTEPFTCEYHLTFKTPLVCNKDAMLVYPTLSSKHRDEWDDLETRLYNKEITIKGYESKLHNLFENAGLYLSEKEKKILSALKEKEGNEKHSNSGYPSVINKCTDDYKKLEKENKRLRELLAANGINDTVKEEVQETVTYYNTNLTDGNTNSTDNTNLTDDNTNLTDDNTNLTDDNTKLTDDNTNLTDDNTKLTKQTTN